MSNTLKSPHHLSIVELSESLRNGSLTSVALTKHFLDRIRIIDARLNAFVTVTADLAIRQAHIADNELAKGIDRGPLHGIPMAIKDNIDTKDVRTTRGSVIFTDHIPEEDALVTKRLLASGAVMLGKTAMHEFAYGMNGINPHFGATRNPWNIDYDAGGSSSGSAAAVSAGLTVFALGTDTGGSVRQPAHSCGIVGYKPTFGALDMSGIYPLVPSMDHVGILSKSVEDASIVFNSLISEIGVNQGKRRSHELARRLLHIRLGVDVKTFTMVDSEADERVFQVIGLLKKRGAIQVNFHLEGFENTLRANRITFLEANKRLWPLYKANPTAFGSDLAAKLETAQQWGKTQYKLAQNYRNHFRDQINGLFERCDLIALPTSSIAAAPIAERPQDHPYLAWRNCGFLNFSGHPAISIPVGRLHCGLPVGLMLVAPLHADQNLLAAAKLIESNLPRIGRSPLCK